MIRTLLAPVLLWAAATGAAAQSAAPIDMLYRALGMNDLLAVMREEGLGYGREMQVDLLEGRGGARWAEAVSGIYDVGRMGDTIRARLDSELAAEDLAPMIAFFTSDIGRQVVALEVSAREAFLEEEIEDASLEIFRDMERDKDPRSDQIKMLVETADLIESNVVGAMNSNYAFYVGLASGGALPEQLSEAEILADVWGQEDEIRRDTTEWLYSYLNMAYTPLSDDEVDVYTAFYDSPPGQALNQAIFVAFDELFTGISFALGQSAAAFLAGEEL